MHDHCVEDLSSSTRVEASNKHKESFQRKPKSANPSFSQDTNNSSSNLLPRDDCPSSLISLDSSLSQHGDGASSNAEIMITRKHSLEKKPSVMFESRFAMRKKARYIKSRGSKFYQEQQFPATGAPEFKRFIKKQSHLHCETRAFPPPTDSQIQ
ncbi:hypothetical protein N431DRAFT_472489 [Stipitochalara longipes BDJ]|nr:hypothetical protein N431DRAFT_472489 [Stipitochalara longipes BDJ]